MLENSLEFERLAPDDNLKQGDLLEWKVAHRNLPWDYLGLVVTSDCDLEHRKHAGLASYVPVLPLKVYLELFELPRLIQVEREYLSKIVQSQSEIRDPLDVELFLDFFASDADTTDSPQLSKNLELWQNLQRTLSTPSAMNQTVKIIIAAMSARGVKSADKNLAKQLVERINRLPGDRFLLSSLPNHTGAAVAYLRRICHIDIDAVATNTLTNREPHRRAQRIARLKSPFVYALTQQLASVFASIGLPDQRFSSHSAEIQELVAGAL